MNFLNLFRKTTYASAAVAAWTLSGCTSFQLTGPTAQSAPHERLVRVAEIYRDQGNTERARSLYEQVLTKDPTYQPAIDALAAMDGPQNGTTANPTEIASTEPTAIESPAEAAKPEPASLTAKQTTTPSDPKSAATESELADEVRPIGPTAAEVAAAIETAKAMEEPESPELEQEAGVDEQVAESPALVPNDSKPSGFELEFGDHFVDAEADLDLGNVVASMMSLPAPLPAEVESTEVAETEAAVAEPSLAEEILAETISVIPDVVIPEVPVAAVEAADVAPNVESVVAARVEAATPFAESSGDLEWHSPVTIAQAGWSEAPHVVPPEVWHQPAVPQEEVQVEKVVLAEVVDEAFAHRDPLPVDEVALESSNEFLPVLADTIEWLPPVAMTLEPEPVALTPEGELEALMNAERQLTLDATDVGSWKTIDTLLETGTDGTKTMTVLTLGELPATCVDDVVQRLRTVLTIPAADSELQSAAALALGGLGTAAEPAVPVLQQLAESGDQKTRESANVALACLGYEVPSTK